jgi:hypothetical protein
MANFCIPKDIADNIKQITSRGLNTAQREVELTKLVGNKSVAKEINKLYESHAILKNQELADKRFIETITGVNAAQKQKLLENAALERARKKSLIFNTDGTVNDNFKALTKQTDDEIQARAQQLYEKKYKIDIEPAVVQKLVAMQNQVDSLEKAMVNTPAGSKERIAYGLKQGEIIDTFKQLRNPSDSLGIPAQFKEGIRDLGNQFDVKNGVVQNAAKAVQLATVAVFSPVLKSLQASLDASFALRQGFKQLVTDPTTWGKSMAEAFKPFVAVGSKKEQKAIADVFRARVLSNPNYKTMKKAGLAIGDTVEEFFPTSIAEKVHVFGNAFRASNDAFTIFAQQTRIEMFNKMLDAAQASGTELTEQVYKDMAKVANSISGRGHLGKAEAISGLLNKGFFSARYIKSQADTFLMPFDYSLSPVARKQALNTSLRTFGAIAGLMALASTFTDVETDTRSSKFGKFKVPGSKNEWVDLTSGLGSYIVLASRIKNVESKSATTGKVTKLNSGDFNGRTVWDVATDWFAGKTAPSVSTLIQFAKGSDYNFEKPTIPGAALNLVTPISAGNIVKSYSKEDFDAASIATGFDIFGAAATKYGK